MPILKPKVCPEGDDKVAGQVVDSADPESTELIPLHNMQEEFLRWLTEDEVRKLLKSGCAKLFRNNSGKMRRVYLTLSRKLIETRDQRSSILSDASRTVRKEHLTAPYWCFSHITSDLDEKQDVSGEELTGDGILGGHDQP